MSLTECNVPSFDIHSAKCIEQKPLALQSKKNDVSIIFKLDENLFSGTIFAMPLQHNTETALVEFSFDFSIEIYQYLRKFLVVIDFPQVAVSML